MPWERGRAAPARKGERMNFYALSIPGRDEDGNPTRTLLDGSDRFDTVGMYLPFARLYESRRAAEARIPLAQAEHPFDRIEIIRIEWSYHPI